MRCEVLIDWLTFSVKSDDPGAVIRHYLGMDPALFQDVGYGLMGYRQCKAYGDIRVLYEGREDDYFRDMGVCVSMSGNGCRLFERMSKLSLGSKDTHGTSSVAFPALFRLLLSDADANITRIDIACDDHADMLSMDDIISNVQSNRVNSRMTKRRVVVSYIGKELVGSTVYLGAPSSDFRVRIYDKAAEQAEVSGTVAADLEHWVRVELVCRSKHAYNFVSQLMESGENVGSLAAKVINDKFSFIEMDDTNISRCTVCDWWVNFVGSLEAVQLVAREVVEHGIDHIRQWVDQQVGPSLAMLYETIGWVGLYEIIHSSFERLSFRQEALVADYKSMAAVGAL